MTELTIVQALQQGIEAHKAGQVQKADRLYTAILKAQPTHPAANHNMGVLAVGVGKVRPALSFFKTALETNPSIDQYWLSYIDALMKLGRVSDAKTILAKAKSKGVKGDNFDKLEIKISSLGLAMTSSAQKAPSALTQNIANLYSQGEFKQVLIESSKLLLEFPGSVTLYNFIGAANGSLGNLEVAIEAYRKSICIDPNYVAGYLNLGNALKEQGKLEEAIEAYNKVISIRPDYAGAQNNLGVALQQQGKFASAIEAYSKAVSLQPDYADAYNNLGVTFNKIRNSVQALEAFAKAISLKPNFAEAFNNMGTTLNEQEKLEEAAVAFDKAISLKPDYAECYNNMGIVLKKLGKKDQAIEAHKKALAIKPNSHSAYNNIGAILKDNGQLHESVSNLQKAFAIRCDIPQAGDATLAPATTALHFELTNKCNFHCVFCPSDSQKREIGSMDLDLVKKLYTEASEKKIAPVVNLHLMGEPTLHPKLIEILNFGASKNIKTDLVTNGSTLVAKIVPKILSSLYGTITASHMTPTEETYHFRGKVGISWERYISNLRLLVREYMKRIAQGETINNDIVIRVMSTMNTAANCTITETEKEASAILKEWSEFVASVEDELGLDRFERADYNANDILKEVNNNYITYPLQKGIKLKFWKAFTFANTRVDDEYELENIGQTTYCPKPFTDVGVLWNGDVTLCDLDHDGKLSVGNIKDSSIEEIIQNDAAKELRASMLGRCSLPSICQTCQLKPIKTQCSKRNVKL